MVVSLTSLGWLRAPIALGRLSLAFGHMRTVAAVIDQGALTFDFAIPCEVFGLDRSDIVDPWYEFLVVAAGDRRVRTQTGFVIEAPHGLEALERAETIVIPGWADPDLEPSGALKESLVRAHDRGARLVSVCTGAFVLAAAGLLDDRRATTHWMYAERLARRYPQVRLDPDVLYLADGRVFTSAGTAAGIDLCLHLVALDHGVEVAATVARRLVMPLYRLGGQAQYVDTPIAPDPGGLAALLEWGRAQLDDGITVDDLVRRAAMSPRTLTRRFRAAVGMPPGEWLHRERLRLAQRLLERTDDPIELVARRAGYDAAVTMRAQFAARLHTSPRAYRRTFRPSPAATN
jgi:AraC family transcriptional activator FtrA